MTTITCETCSGSGTVIETRSRWIGGTRVGYHAVWTGPVRCEDCGGSGQVPAITCQICGEVAPADGAVTTIDGEGFVCEVCYETEQAKPLAAHPELAYLIPWMPGPDAA